MEYDVVYMQLSRPGGVGRYERLVPPLRRREQHGRQSRHHGMGSSPSSCRKAQEITNYIRHFLCYIATIINFEMLNQLNYSTDRANKDGGLPYASRLHWTNHTVIRGSKCADYTRQQFNSNYTRSALAIVRLLYSFDVFWKSCTILIDYYYRWS